MTPPQVSFLCHFFRSVAPKSLDQMLEQLDPGCKFGEDVQLLLLQIGREKTDAASIFTFSD